MSSLPIGIESGGDRTRADHFQHSGFRAVHHAGAFSGRRSSLLRTERLSNNMIMVDRKQLKNPNGLILGTPGSGKSFSAKREMTNAFLITQDDIIICDPEAEYFPLVRSSAVRLSACRRSARITSIRWTSTLNYSEEENPLTLKSDFILSCVS